MASWTLIRMRCLGAGDGGLGEADRIAEIVRVFIMRIRLENGILWRCLGAMGGGMTLTLGVAGKLDFLTGSGWSLHNALSKTSFRGPCASTAGFPSTLLIRHRVGSNI